MKHDELDPEAGRARLVFKYVVVGRKSDTTSPDQLILLDDPAFMPDMVFPTLDLDFSNLNLNVDLLSGSQKSSLLSPRSQQRNRDTSVSRDRSIINLNIPPFSSSIDHQFPYNDPFQPGLSSAQKTPATDRLFGDEEKLMDGFDFVFDADGEIRDIDPGESELLRSGGVMPELVGQLEGDLVAGGRIRREHKDSFAQRIKGGSIDTDGDYVMNLEDEHNIIPEVEPLAAMTAEVGVRRARPRVNSSEIDQEESSLILVDARQMVRRRKVPKTLPVDLTISLRNTDLRDWQTSYGQNMLSAIQKKEGHIVTRIAKEKAYNWIFGRGIGDVGNGVGASKLQSPLAMFAGDSLKLVILGAPTSATTHPPKRGREEDDLEPLGRNVRLRASQDLDQIGRGDGDAFIPQLEDSTGLEIGREARTALDDYQASAMPWNVSSSLNSHRNLPTGSSVKGLGTAIGRPSSILSARPGSRLTSASPLAGRGRTSTGVNILDSGGLDDIELPGYADNLVGPGRTLYPLDTTAEEFELFGPSAEVDTQTAQGTQWVRDALARESMNFLEFVRSRLEEGQQDELADDGDTADLPMGGMFRNNDEIGFEALFPPQSNSVMVAAQAFHHVLTLATKNLLAVNQEEPFGEIYLTLRP